MKDQADKLREVINNLRNIQMKPNQTVENAPQAKKCRVITVTSAKGGVGKTNISVNLALNLSKMGYRVVILDADFGLANIDVLFGISPKYTLLDVIENNKNIFEVIMEGPLNVKFISGGSGVEKMAHLDKRELQDVIDKIASLDQIADVVIVDTGAGISDSVISFVMAADEVILVTTPEPTSIMDSYALIKTVCRRDKNKIIRLLINRAESEREAFSVINKLCFAAEKFLGFKLHKLGYILYDTTVINAVKQQEPFVIRYPKSLVTKQLSEVAYRLMDVEQQRANNFLGLKGFLKRLMNV